MRVMIVHGRYRNRGGEDSVVDTETALLAERGVTVESFIVDNASIVPEEAGTQMALEAIWSRKSRDEMERRLIRFRPDVVHVHNTFPLLSPSIYGVAREHAVPVVQTLHNYRLLCVNALLSRHGRSCERCLGRALAWPGIVRGCYRDSRRASLSVAAISSVHRALGTWRNNVNTFLALSPFARSRFVLGGLPAERIEVRSNPVPDPGRAAAGWEHPRRGALFIGRLSQEKGLLDLMEAWRGIDCPLTIIGDGDLAARARNMASPQIQFAGRLTPVEVSSALSQATLVIVPSTCYENCPTVIIEAMAHGVPVVATDLGAMKDMVRPGKSGELVPPNEPHSLRSATRQLLAEPERLRMMGLAARSQFEDEYAPGPIMDRLLSLYSRLAGGRDQRLPGDN